VKGKDFSSGYLFEEAKPKKGEKGYLEPGFHFNDKGEIVDDSGNVYDGGYNIIREAPSEGLLKARRQHPDWSDRGLSELARIYQREIDKNKKEAAKASKKRS